MQPFWLKSASRKQGQIPLKEEQVNGIQDKNLNKDFLHKMIQS